jgi:pyruvate ferredoxin oxidoreductase gamma subunit
VFQVTIHGRGGQGVVTAAEVLAGAAFAAGRYAQALPSFGAERMGAPVESRCRIDTAPIVTHQSAGAVDAALVQDATLLGALDLGLAGASLVILNTARTLAEVRSSCPDLPADRTVTVPADAIVAEHLGLPKPSIAMLGALAALVDIVTLDALCEVVAQRFPAAVADGNVAAAVAAHHWVAGGGRG